MGMDRFRLRRGPEEPGHLGIAVLLGLFGKGEILPVGLGFAGKGRFQILDALFHLYSSVLFFCFR